MVGRDWLGVGRSGCKKVFIFCELFLKMEFDEVVTRRRSVRSYDSRDVDWRDIMAAVDAALQGPFGGNHNNLRFLIVEDPHTIHDVAEFCEQDWVRGASVLIVVCSDERHLEDYYGERGRVYSRQQAGAAINSVLFKLTDLGLGACWIGAYSDGDVRAKLKIPGHVQVEAIISVGYDADHTLKKDKKDIESALSWELWDQHRRPTLFEEGKEDFRA